jgi:hypothetical protein
VKRKPVLGLATLAALGALLLLTGSSAVGSSGPTFCSNGKITAGTYNGLVVTGVCTFDGPKVTVNGNLIVAKGATLNDHAASTTTVAVTGNVIVGSGGILGLGTYDPTAPHNSEVGGSIIAMDPTSLYVSFVKVHGDFVSSGGSGPGRNFPIKDNWIGGDLTMVGWSGFWIGAIRDTVGGSVLFSLNRGENPDSSEVMTNVIHGNLICNGNTPKAIVNPDDGGQPNVVGGVAVGECEKLVAG